jgi:lycopene cyclase domain-containing protein
VAGAGVSYTALAAIAVALAVAVDWWGLRTRLLGTRDFWVTYAILLFFQLLTNGVLTGLRIVSYRPAAILGLKVAYAPVEDLAFGFALITITLCCWARLAAADPHNERRRHAKRGAARTRSL